MISFRPQVKYDKDATVVFLAAGQTHARFKKELEKGELYPLVDGAGVLLLKIENKVFPPPCGEGQGGGNCDFISFSA